MCLSLRGDFFLSSKREIFKSFKVEKKFRFRIRKISLTVAWMKNPTTRLEEEET